MQGVPTNIFSQQHAPKPELLMYCAEAKIKHLEVMMYDATSQQWLLDGKEILTVSISKRIWRACNQMNKVM
jgi:hypothetical protein